VWAQARPGFSKTKNKMSILKALPFLITALLSVGATVGITRLVQPTIKVENKEVKLSCPPPEKCEPCQGIDFDKIKNVRGLTIQNHQVLTIDGDTVLLKSIEDAVRKVMLEQKISRCK
jgi:hypothetical protein